jgi:hypothetical protein
MLNFNFSMFRIKTSRITKREYSYLFPSEKQSVMNDSLASEQLVAFEQQQGFLSKPQIFSWKKRPFLACIVYQRRGGLWMNFLQLDDVRVWHCDLDEFLSGPTSLHSHPS